MNKDKEVEFSYWAFISYSHLDRSWGDWLHRALETYRVPKHLVGRDSRDGSVPSRIYPVFRDREELPTCSDLGARIRNALKQSRYLIVICSPHAAASRWVHEEICFFKQHRGEDRVLCLIVNGEPNASERLDQALDECFASPLRYHVNADGKITDERAEPLAADIRQGRDSRGDAKLKLVAGVLGVGFDELKQRDRQRRLRTRFSLAASACVLLAGTIGALKHYETRSDADRQRVSETIDVMLLHSEATGRRLVMQVLETAVYQAMMEDKEVATAHEIAWRSVRNLLSALADRQADLSMAGYNRVATSETTSDASLDVDAWMARAERWYFVRPPQFELDPASLGSEDPPEIVVAQEEWDALRRDEAYEVAGAAASLLAKNATGEATQKTWLLLAYLIAHDSTGEAVIEQLLERNAIQYLVETLDFLDSPLLKLMVAQSLMAHIQMIKFGQG